MIYGIIPVGGKGTRLGLSFSKEMLPQKSYDYYNPVMNHLVEKMEMAGAEKIIFVHGLEYKTDVTDFFASNNYVHVKQVELGFAKVISAASDFYLDKRIDSSDKVFFGLPDSIFDGNPFVEMLLKPGVVCGLFTTDDFSKVDRLTTDLKQFQVKTAKANDNTDWFWGLLKFDADAFSKFAECCRHTNEIGSVLNMFEKDFVKGKRYLDLGTWPNYNRYLSDTESFSNVEIERKYDATRVDKNAFIDCFKASLYNDYKNIVSTDFYYKVNNPRVEFVRYRAPSEDRGSIGDITIKNTSGSQLNRFELTLKLDNPDNQSVMQFMNIMGADFEFEVTKDCHIFEFTDHTIVFYTFKVYDIEYKVIEIELHTSDMSVLTRVEQTMSKMLDGFNPSSIIIISKYQMVKKALENVDTSKCV